MVWRVVILLPIVVHVVAVLTRLSFDQQVGHFEDDAYYYLKTAENMCRTGRSTFDGVVETNGYHPLWFATVTSFVCVLRADPRLYIPGLTLLSAVFAVAFAVLLRRLLTRMAPRVEALVLDAITVLVVTRALWILFAGMETTLAIPLSCWMALETFEHLEEPRPLRRFVGLGVLSAFLALARLDAILFAFGCCAIVILRGHRSWRESLYRSLAVVAGLAPLGAYLFYNLVTFGSPMTVSARAKTVPGAEGLGLNVHLLDWMTPNQTILLAAIPAAGALLVASGWSPWKGNRRALSLVAFGFPVVYYGLQMMASAWKLWAWYLYPLPLCLALSLTAFADLISARVSRLGSELRGKVTTALGVGLVISGCFWWELRNVQRDGSSFSIAEAAEHLREFMRDHEGYYAMGDRAGATAFVVGQGLLQIEGLAADHHMIEAIVGKANLRDTLRSYGADYLVKTLYTQKVPDEDCLTVLEPDLPPGSAQMSASFCNPLFRYDSKVDGVTTLVYAVDPSAAPPVAAMPRARASDHQ